MTDFLHSDANNVFFRSKRPYLGIPNGTLPSEVHSSMHVHKMSFFIAKIKFFDQKSLEMTEFLHSDANNVFSESDALYARASDSVNHVYWHL